MSAPPAPSLPAMLPAWSPLTYVDSGYHIID
jgi:hypothetical protein